MAVPESEKIPAASGSLGCLAPSQSERKNELDRLKILYKPPRYIRKRHKDMIKRIKSLEQGYDGKVALCFFCKRLFPISDLQIHHKDHNPSNNELANIEIADQPCNNSENKYWIAKENAAYAAQRLSDHSSVCEKLPDGSAATRYEITDEIDADNFSEGKKHEQQRARWDTWIHDLEKGIFRAIGATIRRQLLADKAVYGLSKDGKPYGSSVTYLRFVREDIAGGIFEQYKEGGILFVRYLGRRKTEGVQP